MTQQETTFNLASDLIGLHGAYRIYEAIKSNLTKLYKEPILFYGAELDELMNSASNRTDSQLRFGRVVFFVKEKDRERLLATIEHAAMVSTFHLNKGETYHNCDYDIYTVYLRPQHSFWDGNESFIIVVLPETDGWNDDTVKVDTAFNDFRLNAVTQLRLANKVSDTNRLFEFGHMLRDNIPLDIGYSGVDIVRARKAFYNQRALKEQTKETGLELLTRKRITMTNEFLDHNTVDVLADVMDVNNNVLSLYRSEKDANPIFGATYALGKGDTITVREPLENHPFTGMCWVDNKYTMHRGSDGVPFVKKIGISKWDKVSANLGEGITRQMYRLLLNAISDGLCKDINEYHSPSMDEITFHYGRGEFQSAVNDEFGGAYLKAVYSEDKIIGVRLSNLEEYNWSVPGTFVLVYEDCKFDLYKPNGWTSEMITELEDYIKEISAWLDLDYIASSHSKTMANIRLKLSKQELEDFYLGK